MTVDQPLQQQIYEEEFGRVKGHFGPINALAINPDGSSYCSGAEDGYIRLHHFDKEYLDRQDAVPDELEEEELEGDKQEDE
jgi:translation initiation factor 3 subunit I